jgi:hypothetical protein
MIGTGYADMEEIEVISPEIADGLDKLAHGFQFEKIIQLIDTPN